MAHLKLLHEVTAKNEVTLSQSPALLASTATGTKRSRDDDKNEDSFYGRRPAKSRSKTAKNLEQDEENRDYEKERATPENPAGTKGPLKRLKFNPDIHGVGLEARLLVLQQHDSFEGVINPRKKVPRDTYKTGEKYKTVGKYWETPDAQTNIVPRKIATPKFAKPKRNDVVGHAKGSEDQGGTASKPITTSIPICSTYETELSRLIYPALNRAHTLTVDGSFSDSPALDKLSKLLTKASSELPGDTHMGKMAVQHEEQRKKMEEVEKQKEEAEKQQLLQERFKIHTEKNTAKKYQQRPVPRAQNPTLFSPSTPVTSTKVVMATVSEPRPRSSSFRRLTLDEVNQQLWNESGLEKTPTEDIVLRVRQEAAEKGKESARLWAEQMKAKAVIFSNDGTG